MNLVATVAKKRSGIAGRDARQRSDNCLVQQLWSARFGPPPSTLELGKGLLNRREVRRVAGQEPQLTPTRLDQLRHSRAFMRAQIVHQHYLACLQARRQNVLDIRLHRQVVGGTRHDQCWPDAVDTERGHQRGVRRRVARNRAIGAFIMRCTGIQWRQVEIAVTLVKDNKIAGTALGYALTESCSRELVAFASTEGLFLRVQPRRAIARSIVLAETVCSGWVSFHH